VVNPDGQHDWEVRGFDKKLVAAVSPIGDAPFGASLINHPDAPGTLTLSYGPIPTPSTGIPISFCANVSRLRGSLGVMYNAVTNMASAARNIHKTTVVLFICVRRWIF
jgi:hypothetical protein